MQLVYINKFQSLILQSFLFPDALFEHVPGSKNLQGILLQSLFV